MTDKCDIDAQDRERSRVECELEVPSVGPPPPVYASDVRTVILSATPVEVLQAKPHTQYVLVWTQSTTTILATERGQSTSAQGFRLIADKPHVLHVAPGVGLWAMDAAGQGLQLASTARVG
jgi:hypothetical protein